MEPIADHDYLPPAPSGSAPVPSLFAWAQPQPVADHAQGQATAEALARQHRLEQELLATRAELAAMQQLLEEIPGIFERKFHERLRPILEDNGNLRRQLQQLQAAQEPGAQRQLPPAPQKQRFPGALRHAFSLPGFRRSDGRNGNAAEAA